MIKGKGQGSNEPEYICKHAETVWLNILLLQMMISILLCTFRHGNKFVHTLFVCKLSVILTALHYQL